MPSNPWPNGWPNATYCAQPKPNSAGWFSTVDPLQNPLSSAEIAELRDMIDEHRKGFLDRLMRAQKDAMDAFKAKFDQRQKENRDKVQALADTLGVKVEFK